MSYDALTIVADRTDHPTGMVIHQTISLFPTGILASILNRGDFSVLYFETFISGLLKGA